MQRAKGWFAATLYICLKANRELKIDGTDVIFSVIILTDTKLSSFDLYNNDMGQTYKRKYDTDAQQESLDFSSKGFMGHKYKLISFIQTCLSEYGVKDVRSVADLFCGTGVVSYMFANTTGINRIYANDTEAYACIFTQARLSNEKQVDIESRLKYYTHLARQLTHLRSYRGGILTRLYGSSNDNKRSLFHKEHALFMDALMQVVHSRTPKDTSCIASIMDAALRANNGFGHFHSAPKRDRIRFEGQTLKLAPVRPRGTTMRQRDMVITQKDAISAVKKIRKVDLVYIDPPYTKYSTYGRSYHVLNTIALNDNPNTVGKYHVRDDKYSSPFASQSKAQEAFSDLLSACKARCKYVCISYSSKGVVSKTRITQMLRDLGYTNIRTYGKETSAYRGGKVVELMIIATST